MPLVDPRLHACGCALRMANQLPKGSATAPIMGLDASAALTALSIVSSCSCIVSSLCPWLMLVRPLRVV